MRRVEFLSAFKTAIFQRSPPPDGMHALDPANYCMFTWISFNLDSVFVRRRLAR